MFKVVAWLWSDENYRWNDRFRYGAHHVNVLKNSVARNLAMPHEFVCITDNPEGLDSDIRVVPLWDDLRYMGGCYNRLKAFSPEMADIIGERFVWMDVDCVVTGQLDPLFNRPEDFVIWSNNYGRMAYCGSMVMMTAGARSEVWADFDPVESPAIAKANKLVGTDQAWIETRIPGEATWTSENGVLSRKDVMKGSKLPGRVKGGELPEGTRVVFFHGPWDPSQEALQTALPWIRDHWR